MGDRKKVGCGDDDEQVEELLQAAQDELTLKLSVDSHMSRVSPNYLDYDLDRRFQALRSRPSSSSVSTRSAIPSQSQFQSDSSSRPSAIENLSVDGESKSFIGDDLAARFAALKASLPSSASPPPPPPSSIPNDVVDEDEDDEVEKLIQWAKDAARLDPSPPSDEDDDEEDNTSDEDDDDEDKVSDEDVDDRRKERQKKKTSA